MSSPRKQVKYDIAIKTGDHKDANTDCIIRIKIVGEDKESDPPKYLETEFVRLNHLLKDNFERDQLDQFQLTDIDVGTIEYIAIQIRQSKVKNLRTDDTWYCEWITISARKSPRVQSIFPIHSWIKTSENDGIKYFLTNKTCLKQHEERARRFNNPREKQTLANTVHWVLKETKLNQMAISDDEEERHKLKQVAEHLPNYAGSHDGWHAAVHNDLDINIQFTDDKDHCFASNRKKAIDTAKKKVLKHHLSLKLKYAYDTFDDYKLAAKKLRNFAACIWLEDTNIEGKEIHDTDNNVLKNPKISHWSHDVEFARQILNGINPNQIERVKPGGLPANFYMERRDARLRRILPKETTLDREIQNGNIYIVNHKILENISTGYFPLGVKRESKGSQKLNLASPICLFHHHHGTDEEGCSVNELRPIAIQLEQFSKEEDGKVPVWTPSDYNPSKDVYDWLLAKMWFRHADYQVHQMKSHLSFCHLLVEPIAVATFRCLPAVHPVYKLLYEHIRFVIAINTYGRESLILKGGAADRSLSIGHGSSGILELIAKSINEFSFDKDWDFERNVIERDVMDLPNYFARDDGLELWYAVKTYVQDVIDIFYLNDEDVKEDDELQRWFKEISRYGLRYKRTDRMGNSIDDKLQEDGNSNPPGLSNVMGTKETLMDIVTKTIYMSSVNHAQVNFLQFEYGCFAPNMPAVLKGDLPKEKDRGKITMQKVMDALPGLRSSLVQAGAAFTLSEFSDKEVFLLPESEVDRYHNDNLIKRCVDYNCRCPSRYIRKKDLGSKNAHKCDYTCKKCESDEQYNFSYDHIYQLDSKPSGFFPPRWLFTEKEVEIVYNKFIEALREIQKSILKRRETGMTPYEVLLPSRIPYGIAI